VTELGRSDYVLGYSTHEQLRLIRQARALAPVTEHFFRDAGIVSGMRVLDTGCGMGDVTMLVAQLVGPQGKVVSIDLDQDSITVAQLRASAIGLENVAFCRADISSFIDGAPFDAIVGRLVLEFLPVAFGLCDLGFPEWFTDQLPAVLFSAGLRRYNAVRVQAQAIGGRS
jgi:2-polyprenyl-3-methyl-5-hydroxy-6-metoxy-1,4-benzoquinol methylase